MIIHLISSLNFLVQYFLLFRLDPRIYYQNQTRIRSRRCKGTRSRKINSETAKLGHQNEKFRGPNAQEIVLGRFESFSVGFQQQYFGNSWSIFTGIASIVQYSSFSFQIRREPSPDHHLRLDRIHPEVEIINGARRIQFRAKDGTLHSYLVETLPNLPALFKRERAQERIGVRNNPYGLFHLGKSLTISCSNFS